jgi:hypothetical protein
MKILIIYVCIDYSHLMAKMIEIITYSIQLLYLILIYYCLDLDNNVVNYIFYY